MTGAKTYRRDGSGAAPPTRPRPSARLPFLIGTMLLCTGPACRRGEVSPESTTAEARPSAARSYRGRKAAHTTQLRAREPSGGRYTPGFVPDGATAVRYPSNVGELLAWQWLPTDSDGPHPAVVYFHGAFALAQKDATAVQPLLDAGFAVLAPSWRGENGNPGHQQLLYGEVDDAIAACRWFAALPEVDGDHLYAAGHSMGGGIAALVALHPEAPVRFTVSIGGLYVPETFVRWSRSKTNAALIRFDPHDRDEGELRTLVPNVADLAHPHHALIGDEDVWFHPNAEAARANAARLAAPLVVESIAGDHMSSLDAGIARVVELVRDDLDPPR